MMTQETLREAVRAAYMRGFDSVPGIAVILQDGTPAAHWAGLDAAIATMFERLRTPSETILGIGAQQMPDYDPNNQDAMNVWQAMLTAFQQENSDGR